MSKQSRGPERDTSSDASDGIGERLAELGRYLKHGGSLATLREVDPDDLERIYAVARAKLEAGEYVAARNLFATLAQVEHWNIDYWLGLGVSQSYLGEFNSALVAYSLAESIAVSDPRARFYAAMAYRAMGDTSRAEKAFDTCLMWCGDNPAHVQTRELASRFRAGIHRGNAA